MKNVHFNNTGFPHGVKTRVAKSAATVTGDLYILAASNTDNSINHIVFNNQTHLADFSLSADQAISLSFPIRCSEFTLADADMSVVYVDLNSL